jgi:hypothetical protein
MNQEDGIHPVYREVQHVRQIWIWLIIVFLAGLVWYGFIQQIVMHSPFGTKPAPDIVVLIFWLIFGIGFPLLLPFTRLSTEVRYDGIYFQFFPFHWSFRKIAFKDLKSYEIRLYHPIREYGGWGIRKGRQGMAYTMSGKEGVQLELLTGKRFLIGSLQSEEFFRAIQARLTKRNGNHASPAEPTEGQ